jgi:shikimate kinase
VSGKPFSVVLVGFMGAGKSVVGRAVARMTGAEFVDLDSTIEAEAGMSVSEIFQALGESGFREIERRVLRQVVAVGGKVVATGGGAFLDPENRSVLKGYAAVVHLDASPETVLRRLGKDDRRPLLRGEDRDSRVRELMAARRTAYEEADISISTDHKTVTEVASLVVSAAGRRRTAGGRK